MQKIFSNKKLQEIIKFGINGGLCFVIDYGILVLLTEVFNVFYLVSAAVSFVFSVIVNYIICVKWVFEGAEQASNKAKIIFITTSVVGLVFNQILMWLFADVIGVHYMIAKVISTIVVMIWNYITKRKAIVNG